MVCFFFFLSEALKLLSASLKLANSKLPWGKKKNKIMFKPQTGLEEFNWYYPHAHTFISQAAILWIISEAYCKRSSQPCSTS